MSQVSFSVFFLVIVLWQMHGLIAFRKASVPFYIEHEIVLKGLF